MSGIQGKIAGGLKGSGTAFANQFGSEISGRSAVIAGAVAGVASAAVNKAMGLIRNSIGDAVSRVDTLARFPTVMQNLGYSAQDASKQVSRIATSLVGLPTSLDQLTTFVQRIAPVSGSLKNATDVALAFNNAVLAGGGPVSRQADAIEQFSQMLSKGVPDMMAWRTLQEAMPATLGQIAKQLGITSGNTLELYDAMQDGKISFQDFTSAVVQLDKQGLPGFKNFADQAKDATGGIQTGFQNMQTAITRGLAKIITAVGQENISKAIGNIGKAFETVLTSVANAVPKIIATVTGFVDYVVRNKDVFAPLAAGVVGLVVAMKALQAVNTVASVISVVNAATKGTEALKAFSATTKAAASAQAALSAVMAANPIGIVVVAIAAVTAALVYFFAKTETGKKVFASITKALEPLINAFKTLAGFVGGQLKSAFDSIKSIFSQLAETLKPVIEAVTNFVKAMLANKTVINILKGVGIAILAVIAAPIVTFIAAVVAGITVLSKVLGFLAKHFTVVKVILAVVFSPLIAAVAVAIGAVKLIIATVKVLITVFTAVFNAVKTIVTTAFNAIAAVWNTVLKPVFNVIITIIQTIFSIYVKIWAAIALVVVGTMFIIGNIIWGVMQKIWGVVSSVWNMVYGVISTVIGFITGILVNAWNFYYGIISGVLSKIWGVITTVWNTVYGFLAAIFGTISGIVSGAWNRIYGTISGVVGNIWNAVTGTFNRVVSFVAGIGGRILGAVGGFGSLLYNKGRDMIQGLLDGAGSLLSRIGSFFLSKLPGWIQGPFKKALGIASPSKVFAGYGANIAEGLTNGVSDNAKKVTGAVSDMADAAMAGIGKNGITTDIAANVNPSTGLPITGSAMGNNTTQTTTIQNVYLGDASAVKQFFKELNQDTILVSNGLSAVQGANR